MRTEETGRQGERTWGQGDKGTRGQGRNKTGRERVLTAFQHKEPDRTPIFEKLVKLPVANRILGRTHAGVDPEYRLTCLADGGWEGLMEQEARDIVEVAELCGFDMMRLPINLPEDTPCPVKLYDHVWRVGDDVCEYTPGIPWVKRKPVNRTVSVRTPDEEEAAVIAEIDEELPELDETTFSVIRRGKEIMKEKGLDLAVFTSVYTMSVATLPEYMFLWYREKPELLHRFYDRRSAIAIRTINRLVELGVDVIALGGDFACNLGPMISPEDYREFISWRIRRQAEVAHKAGIYATNASDGNLWPVIDYFLVDAGVDGYEEIDSVAGMDLGSLKERYGERFTFIGNVDCRVTLTHGRVEEVRRKVIECIEQGLGNGGHVLMSGNCIHEDVPYRNFMAYLNAYRDYFGLKRLEQL